MGKWEMVKLGEVICFDKKNVLPLNISENDFYIGLEDIEKDTGKINPKLKYATDSDIKSNKFKFTAAHILYGKLRPNLNKVALPDFDGICSTDIYPISTREAICEKRYICAILRNKQFVDYVSHKVTGVNLPRVNEKIIRATGQNLF